MTVHADLDKNWILIHSVVSTAAIIHVLTPATELLH